MTEDPLTSSPLVRQQLPGPKNPQAHLMETASREIARRSNKAKNHSRHQGRSNRVGVRRRMAGAKRRKKEGPATIITGATGLTAPTQIIKTVTRIIHQRIPHSK